jgi:hypothetical protein
MYRMRERWLGAERVLAPPTDLQLIEIVHISGEYIKQCQDFTGIIERRWDLLDAESRLLSTNPGRKIANVATE